MKDVILEYLYNISYHVIYFDDVSQWIKKVKLWAITDKDIHVLYIDQTCDKQVILLVNKFSYKYVRQRKTILISLFT